MSKVVYVRIEASKLAEMAAKVVLLELELTRLKARHAARMRRYRKRRREREGKK